MAKITFIASILTSIAKPARKSLNSARHLVNLRGPEQIRWSTSYLIPLIPNLEERNWETDSYSYKCRI